MKKLILILTIALLPIIGSAQSIFSKFEDNDKVTSIIIQKKTFEMLAQMSVDVQDENANEILDMVKQLDKLQVFTTEDSSTGLKMKDVVDSYLKKSKLSELLRINDKDAKVSVYVKEGKNDNHVTELLMLVNGITTTGDGRQPESVVLSITGDIYLDKISKLMNQMNVSGSEHLKTTKQ